MVQPHQAKRECESDVVYWVLIISSLPATPGESKREVAFQFGSVAI